MDWLIKNYKNKGVFDIKKMNNEVRITLASDEYQIDYWFDKDEFNTIFREMKKINEEFNK